MRSSYLLRQIISGREQITQLLSTPTWSVSDLFHAENRPATKADEKSLHQKPTPELLDKLLRQAGLSPVKGDKRREAELLQELEKQLVFVEHVAAVDTEGIEPLTRLSGPPRIATMEKIMKTPVVAPETQGENAWKPTKLASQSSGDFFVVNEGLNKDQIS